MITNRFSKIERITFPVLIAIGLGLMLLWLASVPAPNYRLPNDIIATAPSASLSQQLSIGSTGTITFTSAYTYYIPWITRDYAPPRWTRLGLSGISIRALVADLQTPGLLYAGTIDNGIYRSTNSGATWTQVNQGLPPNPSVLSLVINPITPTNLYAGVACNTCLYESLDSGNSWQKREGPPLRIVVMAITPLSPTILYAGTGQLDASGGLVYKSQDAGTNWMYILPERTNARIIVIDPVSPTVVYAETGSMGLIKSVDGGMHWMPVQDGLGHNLGWVHDIAIDPDDHNTLYTATSDKVLKTLDGGNNWVDISSGLPAGPIYGLNFALLVSGTLYVGIRTLECNVPTCGVAIYKSDRGNGWVFVSNVPSTKRIQLMVADSFDPHTFYIAVEGDGLWRLQNSNR